MSAGTGGVTTSTTTGAAHAGNVEEGDDRYVEDFDDDDEEEEEEEEEGEDHEGDEEYSGEHGQGPSDDVAEWVSLENHPMQTSQRIQSALRKLTLKGSHSLTILLLGRSGAGKSTTANSLFGSRMFAVVPFTMINYMPQQPTTMSRKKGGVVLTMIDTIGLVDSDSVSDMAMRQVAYTVRNRCPIDVVLYVDRVDDHVDDLDEEVFESITNTFGPQIWKHVLIGLTRAEVRNPAPFSSFEEYISSRVTSIRAAMREAGAQDATLPYALIENSTRCQRNQQDERILPNGCIWIPTLVEQAVDLALENRVGYIYEPIKKRNWLQKLFVIPLILLAQVLLKVLIIDPIIEEDGVKGDQYGRFDPATVEYERQKLKEMKEREKKEQEAARRKAQKARLRRQKEQEGILGAESSDDEGDDELSDYD